MCWGLQQGGGVSSARGGSWPGTDLGPAEKCSAFTSRSDLEIMG